MCHDLTRRLSCAYARTIAYFHQRLLLPNHRVTASRHAQSVGPLVDSIEIYAPRIARMEPTY
jgi:hypothetical protein